MKTKRSKFGKIIAKACVDRDMSMKEACDVVGVSYATMRSACQEMGIPTKRLVKKCGDGLGLSRKEYEAAVACASSMPRSVIFGLAGITDEKREKIIQLGKIIKQVSVEDLDSILAKY